MFWNEKQMEIPENMCSKCYDKITNPHQIKKGLCHDCMMFELGENSILNQSDRLKKLGLNKHKKVKLLRLT